MTVDERITLSTKTAKLDPTDESYSLQIVLGQKCTIDADCPTGQICQGGVCVTPPPPFDWMQIAILAALGVAAVLVVAGVATTKD